MPKRRLRRSSKLLSLAHDICISAQLGIITPEIAWTTNRRGTANIRRHMVTIPAWVRKRDGAYLLYYICHEITHLVVGSPGHGERFRTEEERILRSQGLKITRKRVYARSVEWI